MLKNESARNPTKPTPLRSARLPDSGGIIVLSNRVRMEKILHSVQKVKQAKTKIVDCAVRTVHTDADVEGPYTDVAGATHGRSVQRHVVGPYRTRGVSRE